MMAHVLVWDEETLRKYRARTGLGEHGNPSGAPRHLPDEPLRRSEPPPIKRGGKDGEARKEPAKRQKYGNTKTAVDGKTFDSLHEAEQYKELLIRWKAGEIRSVACQVPFLLPGGVKYIADFVALENDGTYTVMDAKSEATRKDKVYRLKKRQMRECLGIEIQEV